MPSPVSYSFSAVCRRRGWCSSPLRSGHQRPAGPGDVVIVQKVLESSGAVSWTVLGDDLLPVEPVEAYLAHLSALERSPNTLRAYAQGPELLTWRVRSWGVGLAFDAVADGQVGVGVAGSGLGELLAEGV